MKSENKGKEKEEKNEKKPKVLIVHNYYQIPGGEDTVVENEKKLLELHGHEVILYSRDNTELHQFHIFQKLVLPFRMVFSLKTYREIKKVIQEEDVDLVHVHNTLLLVSPSVYYAAFWHKIPVIQTLHNFRLLCPGAVFCRNGHTCEECVEYGLLRAVRYNCYRNSRIQTLACIINTAIHRFIGTYRKLNYICLTEFNREKFLMLNRLSKKKVFEENRIFIKPNFTFSWADNCRKETIGCESKTNNGRNRKNQFIYVGRLEKIKGIHILFEAWKQLGGQAPALVVCGKGEENEWCHRFIEENHLRNIRMMGFLPNDRVKHMIAESKALIMPTQCYEGFGMTIVEAFSAGTPVIGSNIGNVAEIVKEGKTGWLFQPTDVDGLVECVKKCSDISGSVYREYCEKYTEKNNYLILSEIYRRVSFPEIREI